MYVLKTNIAWWNCKNVTKLESYKFQDMNVIPCINFLSGTIQHPDVAKTIRRWIYDWYD